MNLEGRGDTIQSTIMLFDKNDTSLFTSLAYAAALRMFITEFYVSQQRCIITKSSQSPKYTSSED